MDPFGLRSEKCIAKCLLDVNGEITEGVDGCDSRVYGRVGDLRTVSGVSLLYKNLVDGKIEELVPEEQQVS